MTGIKDKYTCTGPPRKQEQKWKGYVYNWVRLTARHQKYSYKYTDNGSRFAPRFASDGIVSYIDLILRFIADWWDILWNGNLRKRSQSKYISLTFHISFLLYQFPYKYETQDRNKIGNEMEMIEICGNIWERKIGKYM